MTALAYKLSNLPISLRTVLAQAPNGFNDGFLDICRPFQKDPGYSVWLQCQWTEVRIKSTLHRGLLLSTAKPALLSPQA